MTTERPPEDQITALVDRFYDLCRADPVLGPFFAATIKDWDGHIQLVRDFWSRSLLGTERYRGNVFGSHLGMAIEPAHFDLWLAAFKQAVAETLSPFLAQQALARAAHMSQSIQVGLFPYKDANGRPTRRPPWET